MSTNARASGRKRHATPRAGQRVTKEVPAKYHKKRSLSVERSQITGPHRGGNLRSTSQLVTGHPGPGEAEEGGQRKEYMQALLKTANNHMKAGEHSQALSYFKKLLKEQRTPQILYKEALCLMNLGLHREAIPELLSVVNSYPAFSKEVYSALAMSFLAVGDSATAIRQISKGLTRFPRFFEGYIIRGQLYNKAQKWDKAISDFYKALDLSPGDGESYLGLADALTGMGDKRHSLRMISKAASCKNTQEQALIRRARILFDLEDLEAALTDLNSVLSLNTLNAEAWYYKSMIFFIKDNLVDAALSLEQVLKFDSDKSLSGAAIYNLGTIKVKQRDFYGAFHTFKRAVDSGLVLPEQQILQSFVEAVLTLIKRHFKEGVDMLSAIIKKKHPLLKDYTGKCYAYRGFAFASLEKHELAVKDFVTSNKLEPLDSASEYNFLISQGVLTARKDLERSLSIFKKAASQIPTSAEPLIYQSAVYFTQGTAQDKPELVEEALKLLDTAIAARDEESDLFFFRAIVKYSMGKGVEAVSDLDVAIDKAEDNMPEHFLLKGLCYAQLKLYQEAMQEFSIVLQLDEQNADALLYRGRCAFILEDTNGAFSDYQALIVNSPADPVAHIRAGDLLVLVGSIDDAVQAYVNANSAKETPLAHAQLARCYLQKNDIDSALAALNNAIKLGPSMHFEYDRDLLLVLSKAHNRDDLNHSLQTSVRALSKLLNAKNQGEICSLRTVLTFRAVMLFYLGEFRRARADFKSALKKNTSKEPTAEDIELVYNIALCSLMENRYEDALLELHEIVFAVEDKHRGKILLLMGLLQIGLGHNEEARELMTEGFNYDPDTINGYLEEKENIKVLALNATSKYASAFPMAKAVVGKCHAILIRPSFALPQPTPLEVGLYLEKTALKMFEVKSVKCKPEAPWLNRIKGSIQFTEQVHDIVDDIVSDTEESEDESEESQESDFVVDKRCRSAVDLGRKDSPDLLNDFLNRRKAEEESDESSDLFEF